MKIVPVSFRTKTIYNAQFNQKPHSLSLNQFDTVSFNAMNKSQFSGFDLFLIEAKKIPIEKFNTKDDFHNYIVPIFNNLKDLAFVGRIPDIAKNRAMILDDWYDYFNQCGSDCSNSLKLIVLESITKDLKKNNEKLPPAFNSVVFSETISQIQDKFRDNPKYKFDFSKIYNSNLKTLYETNLIHNPDKTGWVVIKSLINDPDNFNANVSVLKTLSHRNWCTKNNNAEPYLSQGDFHIYLDSGKPKLGLRFVGDSVKEIQGADNDNKIPLDVLDIFNDYSKQLSFPIKLSALKSVMLAKDAQKALNLAKNDLDFAIQTENYSEILRYFGIKSKLNKQGQMTISHYKQPPLFNFSDLGIDENKMFQHIDKIENDAIFSFSSLTDLGKLSYIGGKAVFTDSMLTNLGNLQKIKDSAVFTGSEISDLGNLSYIGSNAYFADCPLKSLNNLKKINGNVDFKNSNIKDLSALEIISGNAIFSTSKLQSLSNLKVIGGNADFSGCQFNDLGNLRKIYGNANFSLASISSLGHLKAIIGDADFTGSTINDFGNLKQIFGAVDFSNSLINSLKNLEFISGNAFFVRSKIDDLGKLRIINGDADFNTVKLSLWVSFVKFLVKLFSIQLQILVIMVYEK